MSDNLAPRDEKSNSRFRDHEVPRMRVELRKYLAGVPFSHRRSLESSERQALRRQVRPYFFVGGSAVFGIVALLLAAQRASYVASAYVVFAVLLAVAIGICYRWAAPYLQALRRGEVDVYIGPMRDLVGFDAAQAHYEGLKEFQGNLNRYVELHAVGNGDRIWRIEGVPNDERLSIVRPVSVAVVPDIDERGERELTPEEKEELRLRAKEYTNLWPLAVRFLLYSLIGLCLGVSLAVWVRPWSFVIGFNFALLAILYSALTDVPRWRFGKELKKDEAANLVRDGYLASGIPWVVNGEPARWRLGWTKGVQNKVSRQRAESLEARERE